MDRPEPEEVAPAPLLAAAEAVLERVLALDPDTPARLAPLAGRRLRVRLTDPRLHLDLLFREQGVAVRPVPPATEGGGDDVPDATLSASLPGLLGLALSGGGSNARLSLQGDVGVVQQVRRLFEGIEPDWEEQVSRVFGDVVAHRMGEAARGLGRYGRETTDTALRNLGEFLTEERGQIPPAAEVAAFLEDVDRLREDVDRLAARVARLHGGGR